MNLKKHFSLNRFYKYLKYDLVLNGKTYLFFCIGSILALIFIHFFSLCTARIYESMIGLGSDKEMLLSKTIYYLNQYYEPIFFFTFITGATICAGTSFPALRTSRNSINYLLLPVSNFEKVLVQFVFRIITFIVLFIILYWLTFKFAYGLYSLFEWENQIELDLKRYGLFSAFDGFPTRLDKIVAFFSVISLATFSFAGAVYFKKYALFKTIFTFSLLVFACFLLMVLFSNIFYPDSSRGFFQIKMDDYMVHKSLNVSQQYMYVFGIASSLFLLPLAYFKLKEKEV